MVFSELFLLDILVRSEGRDRWIGGQLVVQI